MARLTNAIRDEIVKAIVKHTFRVRAADLEREEAPLAFAIRDSYLGEHKEAYLALPGRLQQTSTDITVNLERTGQIYDRFSYHFHPKVHLNPQYSPNGGEYSGYRHIAHMTGDKPESEGGLISLTKGSIPEGLRIKLIKHADKFDKFNEDVQKLQSKISTQLRACTTTEKLIKEWPEVTDHIPAATNPLTVQIDRHQTNKMIVCMESGTCK